MPVKRRIGKARVLDDYCIQQLIDGPDSVLLAGQGYHGAKFTWEMNEAEMAVVLSEMRCDWATLGSAILDWWRNGGPSPTRKPWCFVVRSDAEPWALQQFGEPQD